MARTILRVFTVWCFLVFAVPAWASSTGSVSSGSVDPGWDSLEWRNGFTTDDEGSSDDERYRSRVNIGYGFNETFGLTIISTIDKRKDETAEYDATTLEFDTQILEQEKNGLTGGIRLAYSLKDGDKKPDNAEIRLMLSRKQGDWNLRFNQLLTHDVGEDSEIGIEAQTRWQVTYKITDAVDFGFQGYHDFGRLRDDLSYEEQSHSVGPLVKYDVTDAVFVETGYRAGISEGAPDHMYRLNFGYDF